MATLAFSAQAASTTGTVALKHAKHPAAVAHLAKLDADKDGRISWAEFNARMKARFDAMDLNHDGYIDRSEMQAGHKWHHRDGDKTTWGAPPAPPPTQNKAGH